MNEEDYNNSIHSRSIQVVKTMKDVHDDNTTNSTTHKKIFDILTVSNIDEYQCKDCEQSCDVYSWIGIEYGRRN